MDITSLSLADLKALLAEIPKEIKRREKGEKTRVRKEIEALAANAGFTLDELLSEAEEKIKTRKPVAVKYRHPNDASLEWTGRGRQPKWVVEFLAAGGTVEQLAI